MSKVILIAASGLARETISSIRQTGNHEVVGLLDDNECLQGVIVSGIPVLGGLDLARDLEHDFLICAGPGHVREQIARKLEAAGVGIDRFATHVDHTVVIGDRVTIGPGSIILEGCVLTCDIELGSHVVLMPRIVLTHDDAVSDFVTMAAGVTVGGRVTVGRGAYLGMNSAVRQDLNIGEDSVLGMGAVLVRDLPDGQTWIGNPATPMTPPAATITQGGNLVELQVRHAARRYRHVDR